MVPNRGRTNIEHSKFFPTLQSAYPFLLMNIKEFQLEEPSHIFARATFYTKIEGKNEPTENFLSSIHYIYAFKESQHYVLWYRRLQTITFEYFSSIFKHVCSFNACSLVYVFNVWFLFKNVSHFNGVKEHFLTTKYLRVLLTELRCFVVV